MGKRMHSDDIAVDIEKLFKLRLVAARFGEMDMARWWNTQGLLGKHGKIAISRGFPITHYFVQARIVFAVAQNRCSELFNPPGCVTLWNLPPEIQNRFDGRWQNWLDHAEKWEPFFKNLETIRKESLLRVMQELSLITQPQIDAADKLRRSAEGRAVLISGKHRLNDDLLTLLAAGFAKGETAKPAIPYIKSEVLS